MREKAKNLAVVVLAAAFLAGFALWGLVQPDAAQSLSERRPLAQRPALSLSALADGSFVSDLESYMLDQFPLRDGFRRLKALFSYGVLGQKDNNGIYLAEGYAAKLEYPLDTDSVQRATDRFRAVYDQYLAGTAAKVYVSVIPDKGYFLAAANGYPAMDYGALFDQVRREMDYAAYIDLTGTLTLSDYYRTDTHWRQECLPDVADTLAAGLGVTLPDTDYTCRTAAAPFYGVYYGQSALPLAPDTLSWLESETLAGCRVYDYETDGDIPLYDESKTTAADPYELFLGGSKSLLVIENPASHTGRNLVIFRDSFGSSLAPLLVSGYDTVTLVDIRYLSPALLGRFVTFTDQDVLFLYSTSVLNHSQTIK